MFSFIVRLYHNYLIEKSRRYDIQQWKTYLRENGFRVEESCQEEKEYICFWKQLSSKVEPYSFRFYSHFMGKVHFIIPEDIGHRVIEHYLNPRRYRDFYNDKCVYEQLFKSDSYTPKLYLCRMGGGVLLDDKYKRAQFNGRGIDFSSSDELLAKYLGNSDSVILKPSLDSKGGEGIEKFIRHGSIYVNSDQSKVLSGSFLKTYGNNYLVQEAIKQHPFFAQFNPSSVNTLRICTYRSVVDEEVIVFACALRMGSKGSFTDNTHSGGVIVKVDLETGRIGNVVYGEYRKPYKIWNDIDFESFEGYVPNWKRIIEFAKDVASQIHHMRLLSLDVTLRQNGEPVLIEINVNGFSFGLPMVLNQIVFGCRFDEVVNYCKKMLNKKDLD